MSHSINEIMQSVLCRPQFSFITGQDRERIVGELADAMQEKVLRDGIEALDKREAMADEINAAEKELLSLRIVVQHLADLAGGGSELGIDEALQFLSDSLDLGFDVNQGMGTAKEAIETQDPNFLGAIIKHPRGHTLYLNGDTDAPASIKDSNGEVVLGLCRVCNAAEIELEEECSARVARLCKENANGLYGKFAACSHVFETTEGELLVAGFSVRTCIKCHVACTYDGKQFVSPTTAPTPDPASPALTDPTAPPADPTTNSPAQEPASPSPQ